MTKLTPDDYKRIFDEVDAHAIKLIADMLYERMPNEDLNHGMICVLSRMVAKFIFTTCPDSENYDEAIGLFAEKIKNYLKLISKSTMQ
jgi:hypothetical protein